jgi:TolA-binding protein
MIKSILELVVVVAVFALLMIVLSLAAPPAQAQAWTGTNPLTNDSMRRLQWEGRRVMESNNAALQDTMRQLRENQIRQEQSRQHDQLIQQLEQLNRNLRRW